MTMIGFITGIVAGLVILLFILRRPIIARIGAGYALSRPRLTALIVSGLMVGTGVIAAAGIAGDSAGESYLESVLQRSGTIDGILDAQRHTEGHAADTADRLVTHRDLAPLIEDHTAALRVRRTVETSLTGLGVQNVAVWGIEPDSHQRIQPWQPVEGDLPTPLSSWGPDQVVVNQQAAHELGLETGDGLHIHAADPQSGGFQETVQTDTRPGHFVLATQNPATFDYVHHPDNENEFELEVDGNVRIIELHARTEEDIDLHMDVFPPDDSHWWDHSDGPEAAGAFGGEAGTWRVVLNSPLASDTAIELETRITRLIETEIIPGLTLDAQVSAIIPNGGSDPIRWGPAVFVPLPALQELVEQPNLVNVILVRSVDGTDADRLEEALQSASLAAWNGEADVSVPLQAQDEIDRIRSDVRLAFLIFSTFTLLGGLILIFVIMALLVEERKRTIAVMRAVGSQGRDITRMHVSEGTIYATLAALAGILLGVLIVLVLLQPLGSMFATETGRLRLSMRGTTLLGALGAGFTLTIVTIAFAAYRAGRLDLPSALRGEEPDRPPRSFKAAAVAALLAGLGALLAAAGLGLGLDALAYSGVVSLVLGGSLILSRLLGRRPFMLTNAVMILVVTLAFLPRLDAMDEHTLFLLPLLTLGLALSAAVLLIYVRAMHRGVVWAAGKIRGVAPLVEAALGHLRARPGRSALITASLATVLLATTLFVGLIGATAAPTLGDGGGYEVYGDTRAYVDDPQAHLTRYPPRGDQDPFRYADAIIPTPWIQTGALRFDPVPPTGDPETGGLIRDDDRWAYNHDLIGVTPRFAENARFRSADLASGYADPQQALAAVSQDTELAVATQQLVVTADRSSHDTPGDRPLRPGDRIGVRDENDETRIVEVIAVIRNSGAAGLFVHPELVQIAHRQEETPTRLWAIPSAGVAAETLAEEMEGAYRSVALDATVVANPHPETRAEARNLQLVFGVFMGIGVIAGIVGIGLVSIRSVLVRRREIGTLRAFGATSGQIVTMFAFEALYITLAAIGIALIGSWLVAQAMWGGTLLFFADADFLDWRILVPFYAVTIAAALLMAFAAATQASRMDPSKALRYAE